MGTGEAKGHECCDRAALEQDCIIGVRLSLKTINGELAKRGFDALIAKGSDYFYFWGGEAADWLDRTVRVPTLHSLTLDQWVQEFQKLRETNGKLMQPVQKQSEEPVQPAPKARSKTNRSPR